MENNKKNLPSPAPPLTTSLDNGISSRAALLAATVAENAEGQIATTYLSLYLPPGDQQLTLETLWNAEPPPAPL
eukprot:2155200-Lingulodinium_polyedra.AAC.1